MGTAGESSTREVAGVVKWFDEKKRYGFIKPDDGSPDVLLHMECLRACGFETAQGGSRIVCNAAETPKGWNAANVLSMDESVPEVTQQEATKEYPVVDPTSGLEQAVVKLYMPGAGYGFLTQGEGTRDIFIHASVLHRWKVPDLQPGQVVLVRYGRGPKGLAAGEIYLDDAVKGAHAQATE